MTTGRVQKRKIQTRARMLQAAHRLMSENGVDETTIKEITSDADIGFGTFYSYFESKDEIAARVLDCVIHNLGLRNRLANEQAGIGDPVVVIANSLRLTAQEMMTNPVWHWWLARTDLMVRRMKLGFRAFAIEDLRTANDVGQLSLPQQNVDLAYDYLIWLLSGAITDIAAGLSAPESEAIMAEAVMRVLGVDPDHASAVAAATVPPYPELEIDYTFALDATSKSTT